MRIALLPLLLVLVASPVLACHDYGVVVVDQDAASRLYGDCVETVQPFEMVTAYFCIVAPTLEGVSAWQAKMDVSGDAVAPVFELLHGTNRLATETEIGIFDVTIGIFPDAAMPNAAGNVALAAFTCFVMDPTAQVYLELLPEPETNGLRYYGAHDAAEFRAIRQLDPNFPAFIVNDCSYIIPQGAEESSWGSLKATFR